MHHQSSEMQNCIDACQTCHMTCLQMAATHCLEMGGAHVEPAHMRLMLDCAEICQTSANFMLRGSPLHARVCSVCAEACERCAQECEQMANGDQQMLACAEQCRRCAESCRQMAQMAA